MKFLIQLIQNQEELLFVVVNSQESILQFLNRIPGFDEKTMTIDPRKVPLYLELPVEFKTIPLTQTSFELNDQIQVKVKKTRREKKLVSETIRVDAYSLGLDEVESYLVKREENVRFITHYAHSKGLKLERAYRLSQDGEALIVNQNMNSRFLCHLDPIFTEMTQNQLKQLIDQKEG